MIAWIASKLTVLQANPLTRHRCNSVGHLAPRLGKLAPERGDFIGKKTVS